MQIKLSDHFNYKNLLRFCLSPIIMMVFTSVYGVVDGFFVSNYAGKTPFAAVNLIFPLMMIFGGIGFMIGTGGNALVAKTLGEKQPEKANRYFTMMIVFAVIAGITTSAVGFIFMPNVAKLLGADSELLPYCVTYGRIVVAFNTAFMLQNLFQSFLVTAEKPKLGLLATVAAGCTNMFLDFLFVGVFRWGIAGAAVATGISQCVGGVLPCLYFLMPNSSLLRLTPTKLEAKPIIHACANGSSEFISNATSSIVGMVYNLQLLKFAGQNGVSAYGTMMYIDFIFIAVFIGYSIGSAPIIGYHFGAQNHAELKNLLKKSVFLMIFSGILMFILAQCITVPLAKVFVGYDEALLEMTSHGFRIYVIMFLFAGFNIFSSSFFTALNNGAVSAAISFLRTFGFKLTAVLILPIFLELDGIWWAAIFAEAASFAISWIFLVAKKNKYHYM